MENLAELIESFKEEVVEETTKEVKVEPKKISFVTLNVWAKKYREDLNTCDVKLIQTKSDDVDPEETLLFKATSPKSKKDIYIIKNATSMSLPDLPPISCYFYNNGELKVVYDVSGLIDWTEKDRATPPVFLKEYVGKSNNILVWMTEIEREVDVLENDVKVKTSKVYIVPFSSVKKKRTDIEAIDVVKPDLDRLFEGISSPVNIEDIALQDYPQILKVKDQISDRLDAIDWLLKRESSMYDAHHQKVLDQILIFTTKY